MERIIIKDLAFRPYIGAAEIEARVAALGQDIGRAYAGKCPLFLVVLNGAFVFAADLVRACAIESEITFVRLASYDGLASSGKVKTILGLPEGLDGRHIIIVEDIIDSGRTLAGFIPQLQQHLPASIAVAALLVKPDALEHRVSIDYKGFDIPTKFVVGYGLDYDGLGRQLPDIYQLEE
jgi:hypoxanthine phosphoribosyltransferase